MYGFDLKIGQLSKVNINRLHGSLHDNIYFLYKKNWKIIHLQRQNLFRRAISGCLATNRNKWHTTEDEKFVAIYIKPEDLLKKLIFFEKMDNLEIDILKNIPHLKLLYI